MDRFINGARKVNVQTATAIAFSKASTINVEDGVRKLLGLGDIPAAFIDVGYLLASIGVSKDKHASVQKVVGSSKFRLTSHHEEIQRSALAKGQQLRVIMYMIDINGSGKVYMVDAGYVPHSHTGQTFMYNQLVNESPVPEGTSIVTIVNNASTSTEKAKMPTFQLPCVNGVTSRDKDSFNVGLLSDMIGILIMRLAETGDDEPQLFPDGEHFYDVANIDEPPTVADEQAAVTMFVAFMCKSKHDLDYFCVRMRAFIRLCEKREPGYCRRLTACNQGYTRCRDINDLVSKIAENVEKLAAKYANPDTWLTLPVAVKCVRALLTEDD